MFHVGDAFEVMSRLPDGSVDLVLTSPPFLALRSYLPADHPDKAAEIGSEANPAEFIDVLLRLSAEWERLLAPHGTIAIELGDTYSGSSQSGGDEARGGRVDKSQSSTVVQRGDVSAKRHGGCGWPRTKSLALVPELYRIGLAYGINPLTGAESPAGRWRVRNVIRWVRPNPPVGALGDKFRPATSEMVVACKSAKRWFDLDAVRTEHTKINSDGVMYTSPNGDRNDGGATPRASACNPAGAPPLDWWKISPKGYAGAHYAVWPPELCVTPIKAMCPLEVCRECGKPRERITETRRTVTGPLDTHRGSGSAGVKGGQFGHGSAYKSDTETLGFTDCGHGNYRPGVVLDPFAGSGTTLAVATGLGRQAIGIDLDPRNAHLAQERCGMFLEVAS